MNSNRDGGSKLPLPKPQSPKNLDDKVLAYAKANAPTKTSPDYRQWMSGLAFAGIVGVAVLIAVPSSQPPAQSPVYDAQPTAPSPAPKARPAQADTEPRQDATAFASIDGEVRLELRADINTSIETDALESAVRQTVVRESLAKVKSAPPASASAPLEEVALTTQSRVYAALPPVIDTDTDEEPLERQRAPTASEPQPKKEDTKPSRSNMSLEELVVSAHKRAESMQSIPLGDVSTAGASASTMAVYKSSGEDATQDEFATTTREQLADQREEMGTSSDSTNDTAAALATLSEIDQHKAIEKCSALLPSQPAQPDPNEPAVETNTATESKLADKCYQTLLERCTACDLPKSLEEARVLIPQAKDQ